MWDTVLFDLDGTLTDPKQGITTAFAYALSKYGIDADPDSLTSIIGPPLRDSFRDIAGMDDEQQILEAIAHYRVYFGERGWRENVPYPGIREMLAGLKNEGKQLLLATSKPIHFTERIMEHFALAEYFTVICGAPTDERDIQGGLKENVIAAALLRAGVADISRAVMVGDRKHDILGAHKNGLAAVGVLYGYGDRAEHEAAGAEYITETVESLGALLMKG